MLIGVAERGVVVLARERREGVCVVVVALVALVVSLLIVHGAVLPGAGSTETGRARR